ncbi:hypothetical protein BU26DRAFT_311008 [Trematosphaeria pertusa]|uniref:Uncharacterized protein n=1 Tax=Trematosphaeria pertusa TaxID=390896 RepID=A0A6A6IF29_9PLEO|nr:uncharacterized protein BU26DRAFT_311008 [Trematosphaeria pertusa]KAF2249041.1 hypothetical protein BU26DRAFT_311008 [Trematosphaeria pertusa]
MQLLLARHLRLQPEQVPPLRVAYLIAGEEKRWAILSSIGVVGAAPSRDTTRLCGSHALAVAATIFSPRHLSPVRTSRFRSPTMPVLKRVFRQRSTHSFYAWYQRLASGSYLHVQATFAASSQPQLLYCSSRCRLGVRQPRKRHSYFPYPQSHDIFLAPAGDRRSLVFDHSF